MPACEPWATEADLCPPCQGYSSVLALGAADMLQAASDLLYDLSGRQYPGLCTQTVRPCARRSGVRRRESAVPGGWNTSWGWCLCGDSCSCAGNQRISLGAYPVVEVTEVKVDGVVLDPSLYRLDDRRVLTRLEDPDGSNPGWPSTQHLDLADTEDGTWSVSFTWGEDPPPAGVRAAAVLACELAMACDPDTAEQCRLPKRVTSITREGVTMVLSPSDFLTDGKTGLWEVDLFLAAANPAKVQQRAQVWTPSQQRFVRPGS